MKENEKKEKKGQKSDNHGRGGEKKGIPYQVSAAKSWRGSSNPTWFEVFSGIFTRKKEKKKKRNQLRKRLFIVAWLVVSFDACRTEKKGRTHSRDENARQEPFWGGRGRRACLLCDPRKGIYE